MEKITAEIISRIEEIKNSVGDAFNAIGDAQTALGIIIPVGLMIIFICTFRTAVNRGSKDQIRVFTNDGKYLPSVYVEISETMESLRYFVFGRRWKARIRKRYNQLFKSFEGKRLKKLIGDEICTYISVFASSTTLKQTLKCMRSCLEELRKNEGAYYKKYGEQVFAITNSTYQYRHGIRHLEELSALMNERYLVLVGSAGNGKTSLLCKLTETIINNKMPCMLINARDIDENCSNYIIHKLPLYNRLNENVRWILWVTNLLLLIKGKYFFILIDAINENDKEVFVNSIGRLYDTFSRYSRIKLLLTCRSEYFKYRYEKLLSNGVTQPYIINQSAAEDDARVTEKLIMAYKDYYNLREAVPVAMHRKLLGSLLLTRIFFEVNSNRDECALEFRNAEIYKIYFQKVARQNERINLVGIVDQIAGYMFAQFRFDYLPICQLQLSYNDLVSFREALDNNLIISRFIQSGTGITESTDEYVYFVFDDLRDYCLSRYLLKTDEKNNQRNYEEFFSNAKRLYDSRLSPAEGVIKYAYHHFRTLERYDLCRNVLNIFGEADITRTKTNEEDYLDQIPWFSNFGLDVIFSEGNILQSCEKEYVVQCVEKNSRCYWMIFWYLLNNEYSDTEPGLRFALELITLWEEWDVPNKVLGQFFAGKRKEYRFYPDRESEADLLAKFVEQKNEDCHEISRTLKIILSILSAYDPHEFALRKYHKYILDKSIFDELMKLVICPELRGLIIDFHDRETTSRPEQRFGILREIGLLPGETYGE